MALNAPEQTITEGSDVVASVCGDIRHVCTVAVGDFNLSPQHTYQERWAQLIGSAPSGTSKLVTDGADHARWPVTTSFLCVVVTVVNSSTPSVSPLGSVARCHIYADVCTLRRRTAFLRVTNMAAGGSMDITQQVQKYLGNGSYQNVSGMRAAMLSDALLPCQHPGVWGNDGCTV